MKLFTLAALGMLALCSYAPAHAQQAQPYQGGVLKYGQSVCQQGVSETCYYAYVVHYNTDGTVTVAVETPLRSKDAFGLVDGYNAADDCSTKGAVFPGCLYTRSQAGFTWTTATY